MQPSVWQILIVAALVLVLFGRGRISEMMGDVGKGIKSFKKGITDEEEKPAAQAKLEPKTIDAVEKSAKSDKTAA